MTHIRPLQASDHESWLPLWRGYIDFYKADIPLSQDQLTWTRLMDSRYDAYGLVAEVNGRVLGITHYSFQSSTWAPVNYCYLEDLFVAPESRGLGLGRALIEAVQKIAQEAGSSRLYWNTDATNETARRLYDTFAPVSGKVQYRIQLEQNNER